MNKAKKKFLGCVGLFLVAAMTAVAASIPTPVGAVSDSVTDTITVIVHNRYPAAAFSNVVNNQFVSDPINDIYVRYDNASRVQLKLGYYNEYEVLQETIVGDYIPTDLDPTLGIASGEVKFNINLNNFGGYNKYTLTAIVSGSGAYDEDIVSIYYSAVSPTFVKLAENGDPIINVAHDKGVANYEIQVYDLSGNPKFTTPIFYETPNAEDSGNKDFTLPFASYGIETGSYIVIVTPYNADGDEIIVDENVRLELNYTRPVAPDVPDTGRFLAELNISKADYVATGLLAFFGVAIVALVKMNRHTTKPAKKNRRR